MEISKRKRPCLLVSARSLVVLLNRESLYQKYQLAVTVQQRFLALASPPEAELLRAKP